MGSWNLAAGCTNRSACRAKLSGLYQSQLIDFPVEADEERTCKGKSYFQVSATETSGALALRGQPRLWNPSPLAGTNGIREYGNWALPASSANRADWLRR